MKVITDLKEIDRTTKEGRLLFAALAKITTESQTDKTPYEVLEQLEDLATKMETYKWHTIEPHNNNEETMNDYLENHLPDEFEVIFEDGTYAEIQNKNTRQIFGVRASGDGDFTHHKIEFEFVH